jgi:ABC-type multidrug transport system permease subunit
MSLWQLTLTRLRLFFREPSAVFWTFVFPLLLTLVLGVAFRNRPPEPVAAVVEAGPGDASLAEALRRDPQIRVEILSPEQAQAALRSGRAALVVLPGPPRTYRFDPTRPESRLARLVVDEALQRAAGRIDPAPAQEQHVTESGSRYIDFLIPGLIGMNIMSSGMWGVGYVLAEQRQKKLLKRLAATPMRRGEMLLSFVFMRMFFLLVELPVLLGFAWFTFHVSVHGSIALLSAVAVAGAFTFAGLGLLVASRATNSQTANGLINLLMMPMFLLSGVFFSSANFPQIIQPLIRVLPLTALNDGLRAVMNEGAGVVAILPQLAILVGVAVASFAVALKIFRWT